MERKENHNLWIHSSPERRVLMSRNQEVTEAGLENPVNTNDLSTPTNPITCCLPTTNERLAYLRKSGYMSDLTITFPDSDKVLKAHRFILAMNSPVFEAMFQSPMWEGDELHSPYDSIRVVEWLLNYLYMDHQLLMDAKFALEVYRLAHRYRLCSLLVHCSKFLQKSINFTVFPEVYSQAILIADSPLLMACHKMVLYKTDQVLLSPNFSKFARPALLSLLQQPNFSPLSELSVFLAVISWGRNQLSGNTSPLNQRNYQMRLRREVKDFLPLIHFLSLTTDEFVEHVLPTCIFNDYEAIALLKCIKGMSGCLLPEVAPCKSPRIRAPKITSPSGKDATKAKPVSKKLRRNSLSSTGKIKLTSKKATVTKHFENFR